GRSDYPNQVNNVLGFPYIFRGALDVGAKDINEEMKIAAAEAIAEMAKMPVPQEVLNAYNIDKLEYSKEYLIPKPLDPRLIEQVATAVAQTAIQSGVANKTNFDREDYIKSLKERMKRNKDISAFIDNLNKS
ncbi:MAG: NADP-dependent malic enzyme, partial [Bacteroidales bacterium]|nr:NADP-dependent malic enzyme [Bacteroidales bacterium]